MKLSFIEILTQEAKENNKIILLTGDLGFQIFDDFHKQFGMRYINVGVAEAQLVNAASGLARVGWKPVVYSIGSFMTTRCFEQIKLAVAYEYMPVIIIGAGGGYAYGESGVTHHSGEDYALMTSLPGMTVVSPGDATEVRQLFPQLLKLSGPSYFRIGRGKEPRYHVHEDAILGKARLLSYNEKGKGNDVAILSTGDVAFEVVRALEVLNSKKIYPVAYQFHTLKPFDIEMMSRLQSRVKAIITVEEHVPRGGLATAVMECLLSKENHVKLIRLSVPDSFMLGGPSQHEIRGKCGLTSDSIVKEVQKLLLMGIG
jgi:transketolase